LRYNEKCGYKEDWVILRTNEDSGCNGDWGCNEDWGYNEDWVNDEDGLL
jgi:hypothetical protein